MASEPWFKFYAADYMLDDEVDALPLEAQAILIRMWSICHTGGSCSCPAEPAEIARKARLPLGPVVKHYERLTRFFELRDGLLCSRRMEAERQKSEAARTKANRRWRPGNADSNANGNAESNAQSQSQKTNPPPLQEPDFDLSLQKKKNKSEFSQADFDARDLRKMQKADEKLRMMCRSCDGGHSPEWMRSDRGVFEWKCQEAGITVQRGLELEEIQKTWPEEVPDWAQRQLTGSA